MKQESKPGNTDRWYAIVNPNAGNRKIRKDWNNIRKLLAKSVLDYDFVFTERAMHAVELTLKAVADGYRNFIAVGGDGTFNELVHAIFSQNEVPTLDFKVGLIPVGTGNDWGRMFKIPDNYEKAIQIIKAGEELIQDVGVVFYQNEGLKHKRHVINIAGMGFDALVAQKTNKQKEAGKANAFSYIYNLVASLFEYTPKLIDLEIDDKKYSFNTFSLTVGICRYNGGGMMQSPNALPDDGLFDVTVIKKIGLGALAAQLKNLYNGRFIAHPKVFTSRGKDILIWTTHESFKLETDGESLGIGPFTFSIIPVALRTIIGGKNF